MENKINKEAWRLRNSPNTKLFINGWHSRHYSNLKYDAFAETPFAKQIPNTFLQITMTNPNKVDFEPEHSAKSRYTGLTKNTLTIIKKLFKFFKD